MTDAFAHYLAAWNEPDPGRIRAHLEQAVTRTVLFVDPANRTEGLEALEVLIRDTHAEMPDASYARTSGIDGHNSRFRYRWEVRRGQEVVMPGMDFVTVDEDGRLDRIDGFFGDFAPLDSDP